MRTCRQFRGVRAKGRGALAMNRASRIYTIKHTYIDLICYPYHTVDGVQFLTALYPVCHLAGRPAESFWETGPPPGCTLQRGPTRQGESAATKFHDHFREQYQLRGNNETLYHPHAATRVIPASPAPNLKPDREGHHYKGTRIQGCPDRSGSVPSHRSWPAGKNRAALAKITAQPCFTSSETAANCIARRGFSRLLRGVLTGRGCPAGFEAFSPKITAHLTMIPLSIELQPGQALVKTRVGHTRPDSEATGPWNGCDRQGPLPGADRECPYPPWHAALASIQPRGRRQEGRAGANPFPGSSLNCAAAFAFASGRHQTVSAATYPPPPRVSPGHNRT